MIDDFSVSGVNDSVCVAHSKISLHMIEALGALVQKFFKPSKERSCCSKLQARTFDLKSAYRQVPILESHLKYAYFSIYNCKKQKAGIYQLVTLPFGATHQVYCFLRLARMLHSMACRALYLLNTNFYDDFVLLARPGSAGTAGHSMELLFMLTGWQYAREGKKATCFAETCRALGVEFDLSMSEHRLLKIYNTEQRKIDLIAAITSAVECGELTKHDALVLRGRLGFADSSVHGRLGRLVLKRLSEHAYSRQKKLDCDVQHALLAMKTRLEEGKPVTVSDQVLSQWYLYTDAAFHVETKTGGLEAVLVDQEGRCSQWFVFFLSTQDCELFGAAYKETIIYELELAAAVLAMAFWKNVLRSNLVVWFGDNDSVRYALANGLSCLLSFTWKTKLKATRKHGLPECPLRQTFRTTLQGFARVHGFLQNLNGHEMH